MTEKLSKNHKYLALSEAVYFLYSLIWLIAMPLVVIRLFIKSIHNVNYRKRLRERLGIFSYQGRQNGIWVHAVSVGEVNSAIALINTLLITYPDRPITVTTMTPSGSDRVKQLLGNKVFHVYLPYDISICVRKFLKVINPTLVIFIETEIWPNIIRICTNKNIKIVVNNARMSKKSARKYAKYSYLTKSIFDCLNISAISRADAQRFKFLGSKETNIKITGSIKYDLTLPDGFEKKRKELAKYLDNKLILIAASTHDGEEQLILQAYQELLSKHKQLILLLVPRHPHRSKSIKGLAKNMGHNVVLRSDISTMQEDTNIIIGDTLGELLALYSLSTIVFIGGGLIKHGGHNPLEAAIFAKPIVSGEHVFNFHEIYNKFEKNNGCIITTNNDLVDNLDELLNDQNRRDKMGIQAKKLLDENGGALNRQLKIIEKLL